MCRLACVLEQWNSLFCIYTTIPKILEYVCLHQSLHHSHPSHSLLLLLPSGRRLRSIRSRSSRLRGKLFPSGYQANEQQKPIHPTAHSHFTICHALHFNLNSNTVQLDYTHTHTHNNLSATTGYHPRHPFAHP